ncbi:tetratricopeptide repeat protein 9C isoform X2 [Xenopus tropicalis]|uniref:Tetratricopeptide repeat protein 9C n=1 Tax=Xenopus tropicalis TaxID=8364 RepID=A0A803JLT7_XENTR|nr:tetratricopeptide repeat protein 9C isoform X2 [Xenopus tropicalis]
MAVEPWEMKNMTGAVDQCLLQASSFKSQGNKCYTEHRMRQAVSLYHKALLQLRSLDASLYSPLPGVGPTAVKLNSQQAEELKTLQADCYNNLAACLLQSQPPRYQRVYECSLQVLSLQPENVKALYRAGVSSYHLKDYTNAHHYLSQAASRAPKDGNIKRYVQLTDTALSTFREEEKQRYQGMFG